MSEPKLFTDYEEFKQRVGLIDDRDELARIGAPMTESGSYYYETYDPDRTALIEFVKANPQYHIATASSYDWTNELCEKLFPNWEELEENDDDDEMERLRETFEVSTFAISNAWHFVDRLYYYLCAGDKDESLYLNEENHLPITYNVTFSEPLEGGGYEEIDQIQVDELPKPEDPDNFIWDLFKEFGHRRTKKTAVSIEAVVDTELR